VRIPPQSRRLIENAECFSLDCATIRVRVFPPPSIRTLFLRSTRNQRCNRGPMLVTVRLYRTLQLDVFVFSPFTSTSSRSANTRSQDIIPPSVTTLFFCVRPGTSVAIAAQSLPPWIFTEFFRLRSSSSPHLPVRPFDGQCCDYRHSAISCDTDFSFDLELTRRLRPNRCHHAFVPNASACCLHLMSIYPWFLLGSPQ
jgi:hypothetical protein